MNVTKPIFLFLVVALFSATAYAQQYQAPITHSQWEFSGNKVACQIKHVIPQFGVGIFQQKSGEPVNFILKAESYVPPIQTAILSSAPPVWMHDMPAIKLATVKTKQQKVTVNNEVSERMLQELSSGRFPQFTYKANLGEQVKVVISSVNFLDAMTQFESCRQDLLPFSRNDVHQHLSLFNQLGTDISHKNKRFLRRAVQYVKEAGENERIDLISGTDGFSVKDGRRLHDKRIESISKLLIEEGMPAQQVISLRDPEALDTPEGSVRIKVAGPEPFSHIYFRSGSSSLSKRDNRKLDYLLVIYALTKTGWNLGSKRLS